MLNNGLNKLAEEASELAVVACKWQSSMADGLGDTHYDGSNMRQRLEEEIADAVAASYYVIQSKGLDLLAIQTRINKKLALFKSWDND